MGKSKERIIKNQNKQKEKMNQIYESTILAFNLKELRNYNGKSFLCPPEKQAETQPTFSTAIFKINLHFAHQTKYLRTEN